MQIILIFSHWLNKFFYEHLYIPKILFCIFIHPVRTFRTFKNVFIASSPTESSYQLPNVGLAEIIISIFKMKKQSV